MIRCARDDRGFRRVYVEPACEGLAAFLEQDVQNDQEFCRSLLAAIREIERGDQSEWSGTGNAHDVRITADGVSIENLWLDNVSPCTLSLAQFREAVETWRSFLERE
jgi:hypothetical protein